MRNPSNELVVVITNVE